MEKESVEKKEEIRIRKERNSWMKKVTNGERKEESNRRKKERIIECKIRIEKNEKKRK